MVLKGLGTALQWWVFDRCQWRCHSLQWKCAKWPQISCSDRKSKCGKVSVKLSWSRRFVKMLFESVVRPKRPYVCYIESIPIFKIWAIILWSQSDCYSISGSHMVIAAAWKIAHRHSRISYRIAQTSQKYHRGRLHISIHHTSFTLCLCAVCVTVC